MTAPVHYEALGEIALIRIDNPPVNATGQAVRAGLLAAAQRFAAAPEKIAVLMAEGRTFIAGADITEFGKPMQAPHLPDVIAAFEALEKPVVCVLHGTALGGGLEVALGCHYRIGIEGLRIGLPEVNLGLLPGAGGTQRLPRLAGLVPAAELFTSGQMIDTPKALALGILDALEAGAPRDAGLAHARRLLAEGKGVRRSGELPPPVIDAEAVAALRAKVAKANPGQVAQLKALDTAVAGAALPFAEGMALERAAFFELMQTPQRAGMIHAFFGERKVASLPELKGVKPRPIAGIGIVGGGLMGAGIGVSALLAGLPVTLIERDEAAAAKARDTIARLLGESVKRGKLSEAKREALLAEALTTSSDYAALGQADVIIEAVFESLEVKREVFARLDGVAKPGAVLASNTSYLDVDAIAAATQRPGDVLGLHFFSPAHVMRLLEIVQTASTSLEALATGFLLAKLLGKVPVRSGVCDGFIGNRMMRRYRLAADHMVLAGASPWQVDAAVRAFGFPMGPYQVTDLAGLDILNATRQRLAAHRTDERWADWPDALFAQGRIGRKSGRGYYIYDETSLSGRPDPEVDALIEAERSARGITPRAFTDEEIVARYLAAMINEGAKIVEEGIAARPVDVDMVKLFGYAFPRPKGGPLHQADQIGLDKVLATMAEAAKEDPAFWTPAGLLQRLAAEGRSFSDLNG